VFPPAGTPLLAGTCAKPGIAGIFADQAGTWKPAGPPLPATLARQAITVLRLTRLADRTVALLAAGTGRAATLLAAWSSGNDTHWALSPPLRLNGTLLAAWSSGNDTHWALSPPLRLNGAQLASASFGSDGTAAVTLTANRGETITGAGASWQSLPVLPPGTATLAPAPAGGLDALAVHRSTLTVWHLAPGALAWHATQTIDVPIQFGTSG